ncbi:histidine kinase [Flavobacterium sp.]|uniref:sensor histidine kinase n=1 Tax=Flavobacterium sp. TaxID=239 RepID=UPI0026285EA9|nr:histidine kinase [Flavobacterium sp.]
MENQEVNTILLVGTSVMLFLGCGLIFIVFFYQNHLAKIKRKEAEVLLKANLESEKNERKRIAADIHDGLSGDLNAIRNFVSIFQKIEADPEKSDMLKSIKTGVEAALENTRSISYKLMPPLLESAGIVVALDDYFQRVSIATKIVFTIDEKAELKLDASTAYEIFRIVQEFTTNMVKYGNASHFTVVFSSTSAHQIVEMFDDGVGYDIEALFKSSKGAGISNIRSRVKILEAKLEQRPTEAGNHFVIMLKK